MATGDPFRGEDRLFVVDRHGYLEETYFTFSYSAIRDEHCRPGGVLVTCIETTERVLGERRLRTLHELAANASRSETVAGACEMIANTLARNPNDLPFTLLYFIAKATRRASLCARTHIAAGTAASPNAIDWSTGGEANEVWPVSRVAESDTG